MKPSTDFSSLVASLAAGAATALAQVHPGENPDPSGGAGEQAPVSADELAERRRVGLETARHLIDTLGMLERKTKGNLSKEEQDLLESVLTQLRIQYVNAAPKPGT
ncbi:MAG: DUF1844 domain-containing protein [Gemmatimonadota bacterium]|nr:DUF1844 domain-containing protein [Gemmatimonadota bacterium]MDH3367838.1 DUF1844 domain-containing protein [Gemmatimonadota bacterium]MDH3479173.1 DUF1844 domain-containing protein [Gemmatimonadota bacterium]MDH3570853.1 DUF1844 domain-containing protein [Gemmatimonadota bacterium]MDH5548604.1 DUF1844 domain-containing protein [Gemmatimonadota bacterium]